MNDNKKILKGIVNNVRKLYIVFAFVGVAIVAGVLWLQFGPNSKLYMAKAKDLSFGLDTLPAKRGTIMSDDGRILAISNSLYEIRMDPCADGMPKDTFNLYVAPLSVELSKFFKDKSAEEYERIIKAARDNKSRYLQFCPRWVDYNELQVIKKFPLFRKGLYKGGFIPNHHDIRTMPYDSLAMKTIGYFGKDRRWQGLESGQDSLLRGVPGWQQTQKISGRFKIPIPSENNVEPINGIDVVSTINVELQQRVQEIFLRHMSEHRADSGAVIVMETSTGHVKAISSLNRRKKTGKYSEDINYAFSLCLEPGSTFKIATLTALLEKAGASIDEKVDTGGGTATVGGIKITDVSHGGVMSLHTAFVKSSNVAMAKLVSKYYSHRPKEYVEALKSLGFGQRMQLQIPGSRRSTVSLSAGSPLASLASMSYGYSVTVSPIHMLAFCNAIANGGKFIKPQFVKELRYGRDSVVVVEPEVVIPKIASDKTLSLVRRAMEAVVTDGTAKVLKSNDYKVAAKTGTARVVYQPTRRYGHHNGVDYQGTTVGFFPADDPKYTIIVSIVVFREQGAAGKYYGGSTAAPVFREIADYMYNSDLKFAKQKSSKQAEAAEKLTVKNGYSDKTDNVLRSLGVSPNDKKIDKSIYVKAGDSDSIVRKQPSINDVRGLTLTEAVTRLEKNGYKVTSQGRGVVTKQETDSLNKSVKLYLR